MKLSKVLKIAVSMAIVVVAMLALTGCGSRDLVGRWELSGASYLSNSEFREWQDGETLHIEFLEGGRGVEIWEFDGEEERIEFTFSYLEDVLVIVGGFFFPGTHTFDISGSTLRVHMFQNHGDYYSFRSR
ncbi:MAG: hypothetical protein FWC69_00840 [Defluviitaleaceae bacterium]|nr:hypothetical protein [Defluviitaleaceae bacterium]